MSDQPIHSAHSIVRATDGGQLLVFTSNIATDVYGLRIGESG